MDAVFEELVGVDSRAALKFFVENLRDTAGNQTLREDETLYVASILAHYAQTSRADTLSIPSMANLSEVFDAFILHTPGLTDSEMESKGFFVCAPDLEDELIRALGISAVERILEEEGDLTSFRTFQQQPAQRARSDQARLRRFMGTRGGRKIHYAPLLVQALAPASTPRPLQLLLQHI